ncbi:MAG: hypothetical protein ACI8WB_001665, partial [Phenylobacterium sp.]
TLDDCLAKTQFYLEHELTISGFLLRYSEIIYPLLVRYLYLMDNRTEGLLDEKAFHHTLTSCDFHQLYFIDSWNEFETDIVALTAQLSATISEDGLRLFVDRIERKGINKTNSYQFINGHTLANNIVQPIVKAIRDQLKNAERDRIKESFAGQDIKTRINEMQNHFNTKCSFDTLVANCELKKQGSIYQRVCSQLVSLSQ